MAHERSAQSRTTACNIAYLSESTRKYPLKQSAPAYTSSRRQRKQLLNSIVTQTPYDQAGLMVSCGGCPGNDPLYDSAPQPWCYRQPPQQRGKNCSAASSCLLSNCSRRRNWGVLVPPLCWHLHWGWQPLHQSRTIVCMRCAIWGSSSNSISGSASDCKRNRSAISRFKSHILWLDSRAGVFLGIPRGDSGAVIAITESDTA